MEELKILLLEDNPTDAVLLREVLSKDPAHSFHLECAERLGAGLDLIGQRTYDVVLLDLNLPDRQGLATYLALRERFPEMPVVVLSGLSDEHTAEQAVQAGAQDYLVKGQLAPGLLSRAIRYAVERQQIHASLAVNERRFRALVENSSDAIALIDSTGLLVYETPAARRILGNRPEDDSSPPVSVFTYIHPDDYPQAAEILQQALAHPFLPIHARLRYRHENGHWCWLEGYATNLLSDASVRAIVLNYHDISERMQAERQLQESERFFQSTLDSLTSHVCVLDETGVILQVNRAWCAFADSNPPVPENYCIGMNYLALCDSAAGSGDDDAAGFAAGIRAVLSGEIEVFNLEYPCHSAGEQRWFVGRVTRFSGGGPQRVVVAHQNITQSKEVEFALQASEQLHRAVLQTALDGYWLLDMQGRIVDINEAACRMTGYSREEMMRLRISDLDALEVPSETATRIRKIKRDGSDRFETVYRRKDGQLINVEVTVSYLDFQGGYMVSFHRDITDRKKAERALMHSEAQYRLLAENMSDMVWLLDLGFHSQYASPSTIRQTGYPLEELIELSLEDILTPASVSVVKAVHAEALGAENLSRPDPNLVFHLELEFCRKDGSRFWSENKVALILDMDGQPVSILTVGRDITERKRIEENLQASQRTLQLFVEYAPAAIAMFDRDMRYIAASRRYLADYRLVEQSLVGRSHYEIFPEVPERWKEIHRRCLAGAVESCSEDIFPRADGTLDWVRWEIHPWYDYTGEIGGILLFSVLTTESKLASDALNHRNEELALLLEAGRQLSSTLDLNEIYDLLYRYISRSIPCDHLIVSSFEPDRQLIRGEYVRGPQGVMDVASLPPIPLEPEGQGTQSVVIRSGQSMLLPDYQASVRTSAVKYITDEHGTLVDDANQGEEPTRSAILVPLLVEGQVAGVLQVFSKHLNAHTEDHLRFVEALIFRVSAALSNAALFNRVQAELVERRRAEEEVRMLNAELEQRVARRTADLSRLNAELQRAARAKDEFLASMSHELRTPLNAILTLAESLEERTYGPLDDRQLKPLRTIAESGHHLLHLINDILDLSKIEAGKLELQPGSLAVEPLCQASLRLVRQLAQKKNLRVLLEIDPNLNTIHADGRLLKQMLVNLLGNAVKFTAENGSIGLQVAGDAEHGVARFTVWDTGIGISPDAVQRLFRPFVQVDSGLSRQYGGTGLGLSLVYRMAELHGGGVSLESTPGQGSRFTISLPWAGPAAAPGTGPLEPTGGASLPHARLMPGSPNPRPPLLLIAEDNLANQAVYADFLGSCGYRVSLAANGMEAIERAREDRPDLIIMDIQMPAMNGLEATRRLREDPRFLATPILALTALAMPGDRERCLAAGANDYLTKPLSLKRLACILEAHLNSDSA